MVIWTGWAVGLLRLAGVTLAIQGVHSQCIPAMHAMLVHMAVASWHGVVLVVMTAVLCCYLATNHMVAAVCKRN
jgi:hypothetical protein